METQREIPETLDLIQTPAFIAKNHKLIHVNPAARGLLLEEGMDLNPMLATGAEEYGEYEQGCLYLTLNIHGTPMGAAVSRMEYGDVFLLEREDHQSELTALALAARQLRAPMSNLMMSVQSLFPHSDLEDSASVNRGLYQLMRILNNMADAKESLDHTRQETMNLPGLLGEVLEKAQLPLKEKGVILDYQGFDSPIYCLADRDQLERALLNMLSNAAKFTPEGGSIQVSLARKGRMLLLSVQDDGQGIDQDLIPGLFTRYLRQPAIEDVRFGIGLGMVLVRAAAHHHGGTVLVDSPAGKGNRITMTLAIRQSDGNQLRSPTLMRDYSGGWDHMLTELADVLPADAYKP